jgi:hypothetical protein
LPIIANNQWQLPIYYCQKIKYEFTLYRNTIME